MALINAYATCGQIEKAKRVFTVFSNLFVWVPFVLSIKMT